MSVEVSVDPELCIGSGDCVRLVPTAFRLDESESVSHPTAEAGTVPLEQLLDAARSCPTQAIVIVDDAVVLHGSTGRNPRAGNERDG
jgi:ferredoxin